MEFTVKYDDRVLSAAAITLFLHRWRPLFPWPVTVLATLLLLVGAVSVYLRGPFETTVLCLSLFILNVVAWLGVYAAHRARVVRHSGEVARVLIGEDLVHVESAKGVSEFSWKAIREVEIGPISVVLFATRGTGFILPTCAIPSAAMEIIEKKGELIRSETP